MQNTNDASLFLNLRAAILQEDPALRCNVQVIDGHVIYKRGIIARFATDKQARDLLLNCGYEQKSEHVFEAMRGGRISVPRKCFRDPCCGLAPGHHGACQRFTRGGVSETRNWTRDIGSENVK